MERLGSEIAETAALAAVVVVAVVVVVVVDSNRASLCLARAVDLP